MAREKGRRTPLFRHSSSWLKLAVTGYRRCRNPSRRRWRSHCRAKPQRSQLLYKPPIGRAATVWEDEGGNEVSLSSAVPVEIMTTADVFEIRATATAPATLGVAAAAEN
ncbi:uncharacterized protein DS421_17g580420 [Arachis hypogaea]|nr:uncharacterized protein DS421_17g580420 [Arachis hypogaea]